MPIKKKPVESPAPPEAAAPKPRRPAARARKNDPPALASGAAPVATPRGKSAAAAPAATHKVRARGAVVRGLSQKPALFDVEAHRAEIEKEAYFLWLDRGCAHENADGDWLKAIGIVKARRE